MAIVLAHSQGAKAVGLHYRFANGHKHRLLRGRQSPIGGRESAGVDRKSDIPGPRLKICQRVQVRGQQFVSSSRYKIKQMQQLYDLSHFSSAAGPVCTGWPLANRLVGIVIWIWALGPSRGLLCCCAFAEQDVRVCVSVAQR